MAEKKGEFLNGCWFVGLFVCWFIFFSLRKRIDKDNSEQKILKIFSHNFSI